MDPLLKILLGGILICGTSMANPIWSSPPSSFAPVGYLLGVALIIWAMIELGNPKDPWAGA